MLRVRTQDDNRDGRNVKRTEPFGNFLRFAGLARPATASAIMIKKLHIIGGGLAGSEAAWQAAESGIDVVLHEMRPVRGTDAHQTDSLAELVCSNSFRSDDWQNNAVGLLHEEMRRAGSLVMRAADAHKLPAGGGP